ncbi:LLM class flavin-dependent oxidoreductase [Bermanella marisrubri]|uniref:Luciferase-like domain-containing protein n=1 Tax=Bermanella marisrubri TaxID=207949 RepID=Q1N1E8_9GAMM|nr:LLM class flavin-dependent oxidoreductase [Bermanella marisrubri]EAT12102.1 hypothetical protein RED65_03650 [Oceanobacter sp. RED65] [Bermanella marisrubri]QIZ83567.1 LLM class flavin-dependent oxidoreductase [Bermanella marisrubri]
MKLSVLDQSMARDYDHAQLALSETIEMAKWCEQLGYERFWISEHHGFPTVAGSAPEVLLAALGAATQHIRLGSGGIMLPHYSAYKVAEVFSLLGNLYPDRIDLGVGRAPGTDMATAMALATDGQPKFSRFPQLVDELMSFLGSEKSDPLVSPKPPERLPIWMLGSSPDSAKLAAEKGLPYNLAAFINPQVQPEFIEFYKNQFKSSSYLESPYACLTVSVFCHDDEEYAHLMKKTFDVNFYRFITGQSGGRFLMPEQVKDYLVTPELAQFMQSRDLYRAVGTQKQVMEKLHFIRETFALDEIMVVSNCYYLEDRKRCFELLIEAGK